MNLWTILLFAVSLGLLIFIHELGHYSMAKLFKVYVLEFSFGFGPVLLKKKGKETQYSLRALPLGGYVSMFGEAEDAPKDLVVPPERSLIGIAKWKRAIIMSAGIILNFVLAFVLFFVSNFAFTQRSLTNELVIGAGSLGETAGIQSGEVLDFTDLREGDVIGVSNDSVQYSVTYVGFSSYEDKLQDILSFSRVENEETIYYVPTELTDTITFPVTIKTYTSETEYTTRQVNLTFTTESSEVDGETIYAWADTGIGFDVISYRYTFFEAIAQSGKDWWNGFTMIGKTLAGLFVGQGYENIGGIVSIFSTTSTIFSTLGFGTYIYVWGLISVNIAMFNLLPFPGLDGWHLLVIAIEGITRKEIPSKVKNIVSAVGVAILLVLMVALIFKDVIALF